MTPDELRSALDELGWTQGDLARRLGVTQKAVSAWRRGRVPRYCAAYLGLSLDLKRLSERWL